MSTIPDGSRPSGKPLRLLKAVPNKVYNRLIVRYPYQTDRDYALFYHESASRLASTFEGRPMDDLILIPFLMLYRQAFELQLKNFVRYLAKVRQDYHEPQNLDLDRDVIDTRLAREIGHNLAKLLNEVLTHYDALDLSERFPDSTNRLILMIHDADDRGTTFRYAGQMPASHDRADFPDLVSLLNEEYTLLVAVEDWVDGIYSAVPTNSSEGTTLFLNHLRRVHRAVCPARRRLISSRNPRELGLRPTLS